MRWFGKRRQAARDSARNSDTLARLQAGSARAEQAGQEGRPGEAARRYCELVAEAEPALGPEDSSVLALRHQWAHWTGESGQGEAAVELFARLLADRERYQGPHHVDAGLARHQLAHWHGRAGRFHEAAHRYQEMHLEALKQGRTETAVDLLCNAGYWRQEAGDAASALRTYAEAVRIADRELGSAHEITGSVRQRYAELAGGLPFGDEKGHDGVQALVTAAAEVEGAGDFRRASRIHAEIVERCRHLYGTGSRQVLSARVQQAKATVQAGDFAEASVVFQQVLDHMAALGQGPGSPEYEALCAQRDQLVRAARRPTPGSGEAAATQAADEAEPASPGRPVTRTPINPQAYGLGDWRTVPRACSSRGAEDSAAFGPYEVLSRIGQGGFGRVYLCRDTDGVLVAVKTLHARHARVSRIRQGFAHEVQAAQRVRQRFTVPVIAADTSGETPWMAVPYVAAPSLEELAERCGPLEAATLVRLGAGIATALAAIHAAGIVHLDLKPANVLLAEDGPRVIDFGIAQIEHLTEPRQGFAGTPSYASPEQLDGHPRLTPASDVFSLGTLLARLALGRSPWGGDRPSVLANIRTATPDLADLPGELEEAVRWCLRLDPAERPTPGELAATLVPGADVGTIDPPPLAEEHRNVIREHATLPATSRYATLAHTRAHDSEGTTAPAAHAPESQDATVVSETADTTIVAAFGADGQAAGAPPTEDPPAAADLEVRLQEWERSQDGKPPAQVHRECGGFLAEARADLGAEHPLTLRLQVSHAMLGVGEPGGLARVDQAVRVAAGHLGEGHPAVRDARAVLAQLKSAGAG